MSEFTTRYADVSDIPAILPIINAAFDMEKEFIPGDRTSAEELDSVLKKGWLIVAENSEGIAACVYVELKGEAGYFGMLAVRPDMQGRGLGRLMIDAAEDFVREAGCLKMTMRIVDRRHELPAFYAKLGYTVVSEESFPAEVKTTLPCRFINMEKKL